jgi:hypothetical protein
MNVRRMRLAIGVLAASALFSACGLLGFLYPPSDFAMPSFDMASLMALGSEPPMGTLRHGTATIKITSGDPRTVQLTHLSAEEPAVVMQGFGAFVTWRTGDWALRLSADSFGSGSGLAGTAAELMITREDTDPPLMADGSDCVVTYTATSPTHFAGHAECKGLVWADPFGPGGMDLPRPSTSASPGVARPPFDATITFEATP